MTFPGKVTATVVDRGEAGRRLVRFEGSEDFREWLFSVGELPLPPYIKKYPLDPERYQTVYSRDEGSIAAPTAGLHFTDALIETLRQKGVEFHWVTLHVGPGTFQPVHEQDLSRVRLEGEHASISATTAQAINRAKGESRRVVAVGTTTTRLLEGVYLRRGDLTEWSGEIDLFIRPPFSSRSWMLSSPTFTCRVRPSSCSYPRWPVLRPSDGHISMPSPNGIVFTALATPCSSAEDEPGSGIWRRGEPIPRSNREISARFSQI